MFHGFRTPMLTDSDQVAPSIKLRYGHKTRLPRLVTFEHFQALYRTEKHVENAQEDTSSLSDTEKEINEDTSSLLDTDKETNEDTAAVSPANRDSVGFTQGKTLIGRKSRLFEWCSPASSISSARQRPKRPLDRLTGRTQDEDNAITSSDMSLEPEQEPFSSGSATAHSARISNRLSPPLSHSDPHFSSTSDAIPPDRTPAIRPGNSLSSSVLRERYIRLEPRKSISEVIFLLGDGFDLYETSANTPVSSEGRVKRRKKRVPLARFPALQFEFTECSEYNNIKLHIGVHEKVTDRALDRTLHC